MRPWWRYSLYVLAFMLLLVLGAALWLVRGFDGDRVKRIAADWMLSHHDRMLVVDGPVRLQLWPQPALAVQGARLSEPGQPGQRFLYELSRPGGRLFQVEFDLSQPVALPPAPWGATD